MKINLIGIILSFILFVLACFSKIYKHFTHISIGFELVTFATFLYAHVYGLGFAAFACILMLLLSDLISTKLKFPDMAVQWLCYMIGVCIIVFIPGDFFILASIAIIIRIIIATILFVVVLGNNFVELGIYVINNTILNFIILYGLGPFFLKFLS